MKAEDYNSFDRYNFLLPLSAWLHTSMAYTNSLHRQYLGSPATRGLHHAMIILKRRGLLRTLTKGPFFHDICELILQVLRAHLRACWRFVAPNEKLENLRAKSALALQ